MNFQESWGIGIKFLEYDPKPLIQSLLAEDAFFGVGLGFFNYLIEASYPSPLLSPHLYRWDWLWPWTVTWLLSLLPIFPCCCYCHHVIAQYKSKTINGPKETASWPQTNNNCLQKKLDVFTLKESEFENSRIRESEKVWNLNLDPKEVFGFTFWFLSSLALYFLPSASTQPK